MKKFALAFTLISSALFLSCSKDKVEQNNNDPTSTELKAFALTAGTTNYQPTNVYKSHNNNKIEISSYEGLGASLALSIADSLAPGTYAMSPFGPTTLSMSFDALQSYYISSSGSLIIQAHDTTARTIKGTFSCTTINTSTQDTMQVTNGQFNVTYPQ